MKSGGAFRVRRVVEWLGVDDHENIEMTGGLAGGKGRILSMSEYVFFTTATAIYYRLILKFAA